MSAAIKKCKFVSFRAHLRFVAHPTAHRPCVGGGKRSDGWYYATLPNFLHHRRKTGGIGNSIHPIADAHITYQAEKRNLTAVNPDHILPAMNYTKEDLINLLPHHSSIVCIDSDGCVFNTMEVKQKQFFHGRIVSVWGLESIDKYVRETAEFINLYSKWRGTNRFLATVRTFDMLKQRPEVIESGVQLPDYEPMKQFIESGIPLGNPTLQAEVEKTGDPCLKQWLDWSLAINADIAANMEQVPPFEHALISIKALHEFSDTIVVSQTPEEALVKEWDENNIHHYVSVIAGQELGTKTEHIDMATKGKYKSNDILMLGDAPGDRKAAEANNAFFYPINPGREEESWERFHTEAYKKFIDHIFTPDYQKALIDEFEALLPENPPWKVV